MPPDPEFNATIRQPSVALAGLVRRLGARGFLDWWIAELAQAVPVGLRSAWQRRRARRVLAFDADEAILFEPSVRDGRLVMVECAHVPLVGDAAAIAASGRGAIADSARRSGNAVSGLPVVIALSPRQLLRRRLTLPSALEENLHQALAYDLDRHTPFKAEDLYFDAAVVARDAVKGEIAVDLAAARRSVVDQAVRHAESFGSQVIAVVPDPPGAVVSSRLDLLPAEYGSRVPAWRRWQTWAPVALLTILASAAIVIPIFQKRAYAIELTAVTEEARRQAAGSEALRDDLARMTEDYNFVLGRKYQFPTDLDAINEVTKLLPDDTWLLQMEIKSVPRAKEPQRELLLRGESANAGRLISAFEESKVFTQAAPRSPTTKIQPGPGEIFDLAAQIRPLTPPSAQPLASRSTSATAATASAPPPPGAAAASTGAPALPPPQAAGAAPAGPLPGAGTMPTTNAGSAGANPTNAPTKTGAQASNPATPGPAAPAPAAAPPVQPPPRPTAPPNAAPVPSPAPPAASGPPTGAPDPFLAPTRRPSRLPTDRPQAGSER